MKRLLLLAAALALCACSTAGSRPLGTSPGASGSDPTASVFDRFDHRKHDATLESVGWPCVACHAVGSLADPAIGGRDEPLDEARYAEALLPPKGICHTCHQGDVMVDAPTRCALCHELGDVPKPDTHHAGWAVDHAHEAQAQPALCADCHSSYTCVECHLRRDRIQHRVHSGNWVTLHGMAARTDPVSCETCHEGATCRQCHLDEKGRQGW